MCPRPAKQPPLRSRERFFLRGFVLLYLCLVLPVGAGFAAELERPGPGDRARIRAVIEAQLAAFRQDDAPAAFALAAPSIRRIFRTPEQFLRMVRSQYHPVYRPRRVTFLELAVREGRFIQPMLIFTAEQDSVLAMYVMERQPDGQWRIGGVILRATDARST